MRLLTRLRPFTLTPLRQGLRRNIALLEDVSALVGHLDAVIETPEAGRELARLVRGRSEALRRASDHLGEVARIHQVLADVAAQRTSPADLTWLRAQLIPLLWRWRWYTNYGRAIDAIEQLAPPLTLDHYLLAWTEDHLDVEVWRAMIKETFLVPDVRPTPLPPLFQGAYREGYDYLAPTEAGRPYLAVLTAYDVRGLWHYDSLRDLLGTGDRA